MEISTLEEYIRVNLMSYLQQPNINSVGIGYKVIDGQTTKKLAVQFTVDEKISNLESITELGSMPIPKSFQVDGEDVSTDVLQRSYEPAYKIVSEVSRNQRKDRLDPVVPGISCANVNVTAGTLGGLVYDTEDGTPYILSNWHVLHGSNGEIGDPIVQPGPLDDNSGVSRNRVGTLVRSHLGLAGDCAISTISGRDANPTILDLDVTPVRVAKAELGDRVVKSGRTTAVTHGIVTRVAVTSRIDYQGTVGVQSIGGFEIEPDPDLPAPNDEISMGGDSGSFWLTKDPKTGEVLDVVVGLHFAGEGRSNPREHALACNMHSVLRKLRVSIVPPSGSVGNLIESTQRTGYDASFLGFTEIKLPKLVGASKRNALKVGESPVIPYHHFSLVMHRERRFAIYTAHNIDGLRIKQVSRTGWRLDNRLDPDQQVDNSVYTNNDWDRGHLVRRVAVNWGTLAEARRANADTFHYTNAIPQHANFNQDEWLHLEDWVLDGAREDNYRLSVFTGPVFTERDRSYRGIRIPPAFWKIIAMQKAEDDELSVTAFLMNQYELLHDRNGSRALDLQLYQVTVEEIEELTNLEFGDLKGSQPEAVTEALVIPEGATPIPWHPVSAESDLIL